MTIRGGGDTTCAVVSIPLEECARRPGALPPKRMTASWSGPDMGLTEYKVAAPCYAPKAGNAAARRMLIEAAWSYRFPARISRYQLSQQKRLPKLIRDIAWKKLWGRRRGVGIIVAG